MSGYEIYNELVSKQLLAYKLRPKMRAVWVCIVFVLIALAISSLHSSAQDARVSQGQQQLSELGFEPGPIDGFMGPRTRRAILAFQRERGLPETGEFDEATLRALVESPNDETGGRLPSASEQPEIDHSTSDEEQTDAPPSTERPGLTSAEAEEGQLAQPQEPARTQTIPDAPRVVLPESPANSSEQIASIPIKSGDLAAVLIDLGVLAGVLIVITVPVFWARRGIRRLFNVPADRADRPPVTRTQPVLRQSPSKHALDRAANRPRVSEVAETSPSRPFSGPLAVQKTRGWIPSGHSITIAGRDIGGMVYVGKAPKAGRYGQLDNAFIDPNKRVAAKGGDVDGDGLPYWPSYSAIEPRARATYLDWLASGRSDPDYSPGYMFLYFYGLERRYFVDVPEQPERFSIIQEARRLLDIYGENRSVRRYLGAFLDVAPFLLEDIEEPVPIFAAQGYELPLSVCVSIGRKAASGEALDADWLLSWLICHPETRLRTPTKRAFAEFRALFRILFDERNPSGMTIRAPSRLVKLTYQAASDNFEVALDKAIGRVPDISGLSQPLRVAGSIADQATEALDKFSRYLGRNPNGRGSVEAHALLPDVLWPLFPSSELEALKSWANGIVDVDGIVPVEDVLEKLEGVRPEKIGKRALTGAADAFARISVGLAPDPRFALRAPKLGEPVVLFKLPDKVSRLEEVSSAYAPTLTSLALGSFIAHADGTISPEEHAALTRGINEADSLSATEKARLFANLDWLVEVPPDLGLLRRRLGRVSDQVRHDFARLALAMAAVDSIIDPMEVRAIERLYTALGLNPETVHGELHAMIAAHEPTAVVAPSVQSTGYTIPRPPIEVPADGVGKFTLDAEKISAVMADTEHVSRTLGDIFDTGDVEEDEEDDGDDLMGADPRFDGLDPAHSTLASELVTRTEWTEEEFKRLAGGFGLMAAGALEVINEWAFSRYGDALVEEYEGYEINTAVATSLAH